MPANNLFANYAQRLSAASSDASHSFCSRVLLPHDSPYTAPLSHTLSLLRQHGLLMLWQDDLMKESNMKKFIAKGVFRITNNFRVFFEKPLGMGTCSAAFVLLGIGQFLATIVFFLEIYRGKRN